MTTLRGFLYQHPPSASTSPTSQFWEYFVSKEFLYQISSDDVLNHVLKVIWATCVGDPRPMLQTGLVKPKFNLIGLITKYPFDMQNCSIRNCYAVSLKVLPSSDNGDRELYKNLRYLHSYLSSARPIYKS